MTKELSVFGPTGITYMEILKGLHDEWSKTPLYFSSDTHLKEQEPAEKIRLSTLNVLENIRLSAMISLLRNFRWLQGINSATVSGNYLVFCGAFRGFLLAAADTWFSMKDFSYSLANSAEVFYKQLTKNSGIQVALFEEWEKTFQHFLLAKKENTSRHLIAKSDASYIRKLGEGRNDNLIYECYSELCEITHPASSSLSLFYLFDENKGTEIKTDNDANYINSFCEKYKDIIPVILSRGINPSLLALGSVNLMASRTSIVCPGIEKIRLSAIKGWEQDKAKIKNYF